MNILDEIGNTPLVKLHKINEVPDVDIYVKCEYMNPGGSIKDRMALRMIEEAEKEGKLKPGGTIIDQSTGNTGPALAFVGAVKGYKVKLFLPAHLSSAYNPADRIRIAKYFGSTVELVDLNKYMENTAELSTVKRAAAHVAIRMKQCYTLEQNDPLTWWANQLCNLDNANANRDTTGPEILKQLNGDLDACVISVGTGGTLLGVAETLKKANPETKITAVLPTDDPRFDWIETRAVHEAMENFGMPVLKFLIEYILEKKLMDETVIITAEDARNMADRLCREEGFFCGMSSGANVCAALQVARKMDKGSKIATILADGRDRYFVEQPNEHYIV